MSQTHSMRLAAALLVLLALLAAGAAGAQAIPGYLGSSRCTGCHENEAALWSRSDHALAWTTASEANIRADFNGTRFEKDGMMAAFRIDPDGSHHVTVTETDGSTTDYPVHSVVGIEPLQQYLLETEPGRLQSFDVVWDTERKSWFHLYPDLDLPPSDAMHWTGPYKNWNGRCAACHATGFRKNYDAATRRFASTQSEIGVGCEACHGPGSEHVGWAESAENPATPTPDNYGFTARLSDRDVMIGQCADCHSRRQANDEGNPLPGTPYHESYDLSLLMPEIYEADGQIHDEVYVYGSFLQSKMYAKGVSCTNCHDPHEGELVAEGNTVCLQCHSPAGNPDFPTLKPAEYDSPKHHFHENGTPGAQCKNCHMVERVYMGNDWRADHSFRIPRPDLASETGAPDACTGCHEGRSPDWAAKTIASWYPASDGRGSHYGVALAHGRADPVAAAPELLALADDADRPGIVRATALWLLEGSQSPEVAAHAAALLGNSDPLIRKAAAGLQRSAAAPERVGRLTALLDDPVRTVRMEAARDLIDTPPQFFAPEHTEAMNAALTEWWTALGTRVDFPETHLQIGGAALGMRNPVAATAAFREAVRLDPQLVEAWSMLARIAEATQGASAARGVLAEALAINPDNLMLLDYDAELSGGPLELLPPQR